MEYFRTLNPDGILNCMHSQNDKIRNKIRNYTFITNIEQLDQEQENNIKGNILKSKVVTIDTYRETEESTEINFFVICFKNTLLIFEKASIPTVFHILCWNKNIKFSFLNGSKNIFEENINFQNQEIHNLNSAIENELIDKMKTEFSCITKQKHSKLGRIWTFICPCLIQNLLEESYETFNEDRLNFPNNQDQIQIDEKDCIELKLIGTGSKFKAELIYHIELEKLFVFKKSNCNDDEISKLHNREIENYKRLQHPFMPRFIGITKKNKYLVIEYINGQTLSDIESMNLSDDDKITIIFELMLILQFMHRNRYIYRDLKHDNVMIDKNKTAVLIDFDRLICVDMQSNNEFDRQTNDYTNDFSSEYIAPEVNNGILTDKCDTFSLGKLFQYIMGDDGIEKYPEIGNLIKRCIRNEPEGRPRMLELIASFQFHFKGKNINEELISKYEKILEKINYSQTYNSYKSEYERELVNYLTIASDENNFDAQNYLGKCYFIGNYVEKNIHEAIHYFKLAAEHTNNEKHAISLFNLGIAHLEINEINKGISYLTISADKNHPEAQNYLGHLYYFGTIVKKDIQKANQLFEKAVEKNEPKALINLGNVYLDGIGVQQDIDKAIWYYKQAVNQDMPYGYYGLGLIYSKEQYKLNINKAITYFKKASEKNIPEAQFELGLIYFNQENIDDAIKYFSLAAEQNDRNAQYYLGFIYSKENFNRYDIEKAFKYFWKSSEQNQSSAQNELGLIYYNNNDINKALYYFNLSAKQNDSEAQYNLGVIYLKGNYVTRDIEKALYYLTLSANQNNPNAQYILGEIYYHGKFVNKNIKKGFFYLELAAKHNLKDAQYILGILNYIKVDQSCDIYKAASYFEQAAKQNDSESQLLLYYIYSDSKNSIYDMDKAYRYLKLSLNQNNKNALYIFGKLCYDKNDISKAIHYLTIAAEKNNSDAMNLLGLIYHKYDVNLAIEYFTFAAKLNNLDAHYNLGLIYLDNKNISPAIKYFNYAAKQNHIKSHYILAQIYYEGRYVTQDVPLSIYYLEKSCDFNDSISQYYLGCIYFENEYYPRNIEKAIYYFNLAEKQNHSDAKCYLGYIYYNGIDIKKDVHKGIQYLMDAAKLNNKYAQNLLGLIFNEGKYDEKDFNKAVRNIKLAADQNEPKSQFSLGFMYYKYKFLNKDPKEAIKYIRASAKNNQCMAQAWLGDFYLEGKYVKHDINKAIQLYKNASNQNILYAKNNLGVIYCDGFECVKKNVELSNEYYREAIKLNDKCNSQKEFCLEKHNYALNLLENGDYEQAIDLLIDASIQNCIISKSLLCFVIMFLHNRSINELIIRNEFNSHHKGSERLAKDIFRHFNNNFHIKLLCNSKKLFDEEFEALKKIRMLYVHGEIMSIYQIKQTIEIQSDKNKNLKDIDENFYKGFNE